MPGHDASKHRCDAHRSGAARGHRRSESRNEGCAGPGSRRSGTGGRRKDETDAERLHVQISVTDDTGLELEGGILPANSQAGCAVTANGSRRLNGRLLAIGEGPIPWA